MYRGPLCYRDGGNLFHGMNILLLGSGGREHALAWKMAASPLVDRLFCAPGNAGIAQQAECVDLDIADHAAVIGFCRDNRIGFVVVGPEAPLCAGIVDDLEAGGIKAFGPSRTAARLEGSKGFTKDLCRSADIPTAAYERFRAAVPAKAYVRERGAPIVVKADGLAAGKGVVVAESVAEAEAAIDMMFGGGLGAAGGRSSSRSVSSARRRRSSRCATAKPRCRSLRRKTTSASLTATRVRIPAAWAPIRRRRLSIRP